MDAQAVYMYQRNPNEQGPNGSQRPNLNNGSNGNNDGGPGPGRNGTSKVLLVFLGAITEIHRRTFILRNYRMVILHSLTC